MESKEHWERVYSTKPETGVSWFQEHALQSLALLTQTATDRQASVIDVGGGASTLVDDLLDLGFERLTVLDLSEAALLAAQRRLAKRASSVRWIVGDITTLELPRHQYDVWHDRAVFHFLVTPAQRQAYVSRVLHAVKPGGLVIVATFAEGGPDKCSGLPVMRYSADSLHAEFGSPFTMLQEARESHQTPFGTEQKFVYCMCRKVCA